MSSRGFTLGDLLGAKTVACRVRGCTRTWSDLSGAKQLPGAGTPSADASTAGMCEPCRNKLAGLSDQARECSRPGCEGTWAWSATDQLEAWVARRQPPKRLCAKCQDELAGLVTKEIACGVPGCTRTATLSPEAQLLGSAPEPHGAVTYPGVFCAPCTQTAEHIKDRNVSCGINGCSRKWVWKADEQIIAFAAGKTAEPPRRMCEPCRTNFGKLLDREVRCRASGCKKTWTWKREDQLDAAVADKPSPKPPERLCESCFKIWSGLKDVERPCRQPGCTKTWTDRRGAQLARALRGKTGDPYPQYCEDHGKLVDKLEDRQVPCKTEGCDKTWTWTKNQQLAAGVKPPGLDEPVEAPAAEASAEVAEREPASGDAAEPAAEGPAESQGEEGASAPVAAKANGSKRSRRDRRRKRRRDPQPPARHCGRCAKFLSDKKTIEIPCKQCGTPIFWPPESQLQTFLGHWAEPTLCGACKRDATEAARQAAREALRAAHEGGVVEPAAGEPAPTMSVESAAEAPPASASPETQP